MTRLGTFCITLLGTLCAAAAWAQGGGSVVPVSETMVSGTAPKPAAEAEAATASGAALTDAEAEAEFDAARRRFLQASEGVSGTLENGGALPEVVVLSDPNRQVIRGGAMADDNVALENVRVVIDVDNTPLRDVVNQVIAQAATYTGAWTVKWRLKPENMPLLDQRVNLTAEGSFKTFMALLIERLKNMNGVELFVREFPESRVMLIADTYY